MDKIKYAQNFAKRFAQSGVVIFHVGEDKCGYVSYGKDKQWCERMKRIADTIWEDFGRALESELYSTEVIE